MAKSKHQQIQEAETARGKQKKIESNDENVNPQIQKISKKASSACSVKLVEPEPEPEEEVMDVEQEEQDSEVEPEQEQNNRKKRSKSAPGKCSDIRPEDIINTAEYKRLEQRFNYLKEMKETQLEKRYQELLQSSKEQAEASKILIAQQKEELRRAAEEAATWRQRAVLAEAQARLLQRLTSLNLTPAEPVEPSDLAYVGPFVCSTLGLPFVNNNNSNSNNTESSKKPATSNKNKNSKKQSSALEDEADDDGQGKRNADDQSALEFEVGVFEGTVEYSPLKVREDLEGDLPGFLTSEIDFSIDEAPIFVSKLLAEIYRKRV